MPTKFEEIFSKYAKTTPNGLTIRELWQFTQVVFVCVAMRWCFRPTLTVDNTNRGRATSWTRLVGLR